MVLLDSEGIDASDGKGWDDHQIFTLTVLLASVLIYNSQGVPTRHDVEGLEYPYSKDSKIDNYEELCSFLLLKYNQLRQAIVKVTAHTY